MRKDFFLIVGAIAVAGAVAVMVAARRVDPDAKPTAAEVERRVMSPFCPGVLLADCQTRQSADLKRRIDGRVSDGWTNRQIDAWLVSNYSKNVLATPPGLLPWAIPAAVLLIGAVLLLARRGRGETPLEIEPVPPGDRARLEAELTEFARGRTE